MSREIMQQALDALKYHTEHTYPFHLTNVAIKALQKTLAQPEQEPVAWMVRDQVDGCRYPSALKNPAGSINGESQPLYTAPPRKPWQGLTSEDWENTPNTGKQGCERDAELFDWVEQTLKDKNESSR